MKYWLACAILFLSVGGWSQVTFESNVTDGCSPVGITISVTTPPASGISSYFWQVTYPSGTVQTSSSQVFVAIFSQAGDYDVTLTINGNESATEVDYITVHPVPTADFTVDDAEGCYPFCVDFTDVSITTGGNIVEWAWDFGNGITSTEQNPQYCYQNVGSYTPVFSIEDEFGCYSDISMPGLINVFDQFPTAALVAPVQLDCNPPVSLAFENNSSGASALTYNWDFGDGNQITTNDELDVNHVYNTTGIYDVCLTAIDDIGCENQICTEVEIFDTPNAAFTVSDDLICLGQSLAFTDQTVPTPVSWSWDFNGDGIEDSNLQNTSYTYTGQGVFNPQLTVTYSDNCEDTDANSYAIDVQPPLQVSFVPDTLLSCQTPFTVNFDNTTTGPGTLTYSWAIEGTFFSNAEDISQVFNDFGLYDIQLIASSDVGCSAAATFPDMVQIIEPTVSFTNPTVICTNNPLDIFNIEVNSIDPVIDWSWDFNEDGIEDDDTPNPDYSYTEPGEFNITLDILTEQGCFGSYTNSQTITVEQEVETTFTATDTVSCAGEAVEFCVPFQPGATYSWNFGDGNGWTTLPSWDTCVVYDYCDTGYFDITLSMFNDGCNHLITFEDYIYITPPVAQFEVFQDCNDLLTVVFQENSILADSLVWDFGDGSPLVWNESNPIHVFPGPGVYEVALTAINDDVGCPDTKVQTITLVTPNLDINFSAVEGCPPLAVNFSNASANNAWDVDFGNGDSMTVVWNTATAKWDATWIIDGVSTTYAFSQNSNFWPEIIYDDLGDYDITVTATDANGCSSTVVYDDAISVSSSPNFAYFDINIIESCDSVYVEFVPTATNLASWEWTFSDGSIATEQAPFHTFTAPFDYELSATFAALDDLGCSSEVTETIDITPPANPVFDVVSDPSCQGEDIQLVNTSTGDIAVYYWDFGNPGAGADNFSNEFEPTMTYEDNGSFDICLTVENSVGCQTTLCQNSLVNIINPIADFTFDATINNCLFGVQFENTTTGNIECSQWVFGDGQMGTGTSVFHTYPIGVYDLELIVCNEYGCYDTLLVPDIFDYGNVIGPFTTILDSAVCAPFTVDFEAYNINDLSFDYFWDFGDGFGDPDGNTQTTHIYETPGEYCPSIIMTDQNGCPVLIECEELIVVEQFEFSATPVEPLCIGDSLLYEVDGATSYVWLDETYVTQVSPESFWIQPDQSESFEITGYYADCESTISFDLIVNPLPLVDLVVDDVCFEEPVFDLSGGSPYDFPGTYYVDGVESGTFDPSWPAGQAYDITYEYTDANGCVNDITVPLTINALPVVTLDPFNGLCENEAAIPLSGGAPIAGEYFVEGVLSTDFDPGVGTGDYTILYEFTDANGCSESDEQLITVNPVPQLDFIAEDPCVEQSLLITNNSTVASGSITDVEWDFGAFGISTDFQPDPLPINTAGIYTISLTATSDQGCTATLEQDFDVFAMPQAAIDWTNGCAQNEFSASDATVMNSGSVVDYSWEVEGIGTFDGPDWTAQIDDWGFYDITLTVTSDDGCVDVVTETLEVYPLPEVDFSVPNSCEYALSQFVNLTTIPSTSVDSYFWTFGNSATSDEENPQFTYTSAGDFDVTLTAISEYGCEGVSEQTISVFPTPVAAFMTDTESMCAGGAVLLVDDSYVDDPSNITQWQWSVGGIMAGTSQNLDYTFLEAGDYNISLTVISDDGCVGDTTMQSFIEIWPNPVADYSTEISYSDLQNTTIEFYDESVGALEWTYDFGDGTWGVGPNTEHTFPHYGVYDVSLLVANEFGCKDSISYVVNVDQELLIYVPNAFTPDWDGINDMFVPEFSGFEVYTYNFQIWTRWGELIFQTNEPHKGWYGNVSGGDYFAAEGVYVWKLTVQGSQILELQELSGHVTLIR